MNVILLHKYSCTIYCTLEFLIIRGYFLTENHLPDQFITTDPPHIYKFLKLCLRFSLSHFGFSCKKLRFHARTVYFQSKWYIFKQSTHAKKCTILCKVINIPPFYYYPPPPQISKFSMGGGGVGGVGVTILSL